MTLTHVSCSARAYAHQLNSSCFSPRSPVGQQRPCSCLIYPTAIASLNCDAVAWQASDGHEMAGLGVQTRKFQACAWRGMLGFKALGFIISLWIRTRTYFCIQTWQNLTVYANSKNQARINNANPELNPPPQTVPPNTLRPTSSAECSELPKFKF